MIARVQVQDDHVTADQRSDQERPQRPERHGEGYPTPEHSRQSSTLAWGSSACKSHRVATYTSDLATRLFHSVLSVQHLFNTKITNVQHLLKKCSTPVPLDTYSFHKR